MKRGFFSSLLLRQSFYLLFSCMLLFFWGGCTARHSQFEWEERKKNIKKDFARLQDAESVEGKAFSLKDVIALALTRNLNVLLYEQEYAIQKEALTGEKLALLPNLTVDFERSKRDPESLSLGTTIIDGQRVPATRPSTSSDKLKKKIDVSFVWNLLDFGLTYFRARTEENKLAMLKQQYLRARQNVILESVQTYWEAIIAFEAMKKAEIIISVIEERQEQINRQLKDRIISERAGLENQEHLIEMKIRAQSFENEYNKKIVALTNILGLPAGTSIQLKPWEMPSRVFPSSFQLQRLEEQALMNRPELYEKDAEERISADEARASVLNLFPSAYLFGGVHRDADSHLVSSKWIDLGMHATWSLLSLPRKLSLRKQHVQKQRLTRQERLSLSVGIIAQVHISHLDYQDSLSRYHLFSNLNSVKKQLLEENKKSLSRGEVDQDTILDLQAEALFTEVNLLKTYAELQVALEKLSNTIGLPLIFSHLDFGDLLYEMEGSRDSLFLANSQSELAPLAGEVKNLEAAYPWEKFKTLRPQLISPLHVGAKKNAMINRTDSVDSNLLAFEKEEQAGREKFAVSLSSLEEKKPWNGERKRKKSWPSISPEKNEIALNSVSNSIQTGRKKRSSEASSLDSHPVQLNSTFREKLFLISLKVKYGTLTIPPSALSLQGNGTDHLTFTGTMVQANQVFSDLTYTPPKYFYGKDSMTITLINRANERLIEKKRIDIDVHPVNQPPDIVVPGVQVLTKYVPLSISGITISDPDITMDPDMEVMVTLKAQKGKLKIAQEAPLLSVTGNESSKMILKGQPNKINATLQHLFYESDEQYEGKDRIQVIIDDLGNVGGYSLSQEKFIDIIVNIAPTISIPNKLVIKENESFVLNDVHLFIDTQPDREESVSTDEFEFEPEPAPSLTEKEERKQEQDYLNDFLSQYLDLNQEQKKLEEELGS